MKEEQILAMKKFLNGLKSAIMAMDVDHLDSNSIQSIYNDFVELLYSTTEESISESESGSNQ